MPADRPASLPGARSALGLLLAINLFNYIDRQILAAVLPRLKSEFLADVPNADSKAGLLTTAFLLSYMCCAPVFGWLADRMSRWVLIAGSIALWSLASGWSGLAGSFFILLISRAFVGVGEAGYGPAAPTIIADLFPIQNRGRMLALFYLAIPVGGAIGYAFGGAVADHLNWRWAFYLVVPPGLVLACLALRMRDPRPVVLAGEKKPAPRIADYLGLFKIRSYTLNTAAMTAMTFAIGGIAAWLPDYIYHHRAAEFGERENLLSHITITFGIITATAGLIATLLGGWLGDRLRRRFPSSYFMVSGFGILPAFPATVGMIYAPFPWAWVLIFCAVFFLFFNTGPSNTALANVTPPSQRATAFALNIFIIHALGDALSPPLLGLLADWWNWNVALTFVASMMLVASFFWLLAMKHLARDTAAAADAV